MNEPEKSRDSFKKAVLSLAWILAIVSVFIFFGELETYRRIKLHFKAVESVRSNREEYTAKDYSETGTSAAEFQETVSATVEASEVQDSSDGVKKEAKKYIVNTNSAKIHSYNCPLAENIKDKNRREIEEDELEFFLDKGYTFCNSCKGN